MSALSLMFIAFAFLLAILAAVVAFASRHQKSASGPLRLIGATAFVEQSLEPEGSVLAHGELWRARSSTGAKIARGQKVLITGTSGLLLQVELIS